MRLTWLVLDLYFNIFNLNSHHELIKLSMLLVFIHLYTKKK